MSEPSLPSGDRRPVKSRSWKASQAASSWFVARGVSPNMISMAGMIFGLGGGVALAATSWQPEFARWWFVLAALCMQLRLQANLLDGMVAIQSGLVSRLGELYNEVPDRVSDTAMFVGAGYSFGGEPELGVWASLMAMLTAYIRTIGKTAGAPMDFCGPMAKQHRMALLTVAVLCSAVMWRGAADETMVPFVLRVALWLILVGSLLTAIRRLIRIARILQASPLREAGTQRPA